MHNVVAIAERFDKPIHRERHGLGNCSIMYDNIFVMEKITKSDKKETESQRKRHIHQNTHPSNISIILRGPKLGDNQQAKQNQVKRNSES